MIVNEAVPGAEPMGRPDESVTLQLRSADATLRLLQLTLETPVPAVAAVAVTPVGS